MASSWKGSSGCPLECSKIVSSSPKPRSKSKSKKIPAELIDQVIINSILLAKQPSGTPGKSGEITELFHSKDFAFT